MRLHIGFISWETKSWLGCWTPEARNGEIEAMRRAVRLAYGPDWERIFRP